jgi:hypothetical protein
MIQKFRKKPVEIEAIQWNGNSNKQEIEQFVGRELKSELESETAYVAGKGAPIFSLLIETKEGVMKAFRYDWIIKEPFPTGMMLLVRWQAIEANYDISDISIA